MQQYQQHQVQHQLLQGIPHQQQQRIDAQSNKPQDKPIRQDQMPSTKVASIDDQLHDAAVVVAAFTAATQRQNDSQVRRDKNVTGK